MSWQFGQQIWQTLKFILALTISLLIISPTTILKLCFIYMCHIKLTFPLQKAWFIFGKEKVFNMKIWLEQIELALVLFYSGLKTQVTRPSSPLTTVYHPFVQSHIQRWWLMVPQNQDYELNPFPGQTWGKQNIVIYSLNCKRPYMKKQGKRRHPNEKKTNMHTHTPHHTSISQCTPCDPHIIDSGLFVEWIIKRTLNSPLDTSRFLHFPS